LAGLVTNAEITLRRRVTLLGGLAHLIKRLPRATVCLHQFGCLLFRESLQADQPCAAPVLALAAKE
jgi:hypothetical protein